LNGDGTAISKASRASRRFPLRLEQNPLPHPKAVGGIAFFQRFFNPGKPLTWQALAGFFNDPLAKHIHLLPNLSHPELQVFGSFPGTENTGSFREWHGNILDLDIEGK
jgi:hypothetical protein